MNNQTNIEFIQIDDGSYVTREALPEAFEQGMVSDDYADAITKQIRREAVTEAIQGTRTAIAGYVGRLAANARLEARMLVFDTLHGTNYRAIRKALIEEKRKREFEASIGLVRTTDK